MPRFVNNPLTRTLSNDHRQPPSSEECPLHGAPSQRSSCRSCNAAYMRSYLKRRRREHPALVMWQRARQRSQRLKVPFALPRDGLIIPSVCPVLGVPLEVGERRSECSPSLDRIDPARGYVPGNVRVLSDRANRLKGNRLLPQIAALAEIGSVGRRQDYRAIAAYLEREALLREVWAKAAAGGSNAHEWDKVARFLDAAFSRGFNR